MTEVDAGAKSLEAWAFAPRATPICLWVWTVSNSAKCGKWWRGHSYGDFWERSFWRLAVEC